MDFFPIQLRISGPVAKIALSGAFANLPSTPGPGILPVPMVVQALKGVRDSSASAVLVCVDSGGGDVAGITDVAEMVAQVKAAGKRVHVITNGTLASAAYWAFCGADEIVATPVAIVGSIGVVWSATDATKMYEEMGVRVVTKATGEAKKMGRPGITEGDEATMQGVVDALAEPFFAAVSAARSIPADAIRDMGAAVYVGPDAVTQRLIDRVVASVDQYEKELAGLYKPVEAVAAVSARADTRTRPLPKGKAMSDDSAVASPPAPAVATIAELEAIPGATTEFILSAMKRGLTTAAATAEVNKLLADELAAFKAKAAAPAPKQPPANVPSPVVAAAASTAPRYSSDPLAEQFAGRVDELKAKFGWQAITAVHQARMELGNAAANAYAAYLKTSGGTV